MQQLNETPLSFPIRDQAVRGQLLSRRERITKALSGGRAPSLEHLLGDIDAALERLKDGTFGLCDTCHDPIENDRILADPLCRNCLDHLSAPERRALEHDLELASEIQRGLLPKTPLANGTWDLAFTYEPAGAVSGDYCDVIPKEEGGGLFMLGDVTGKGVAASMLMAQLHAIFRSLATVTSSVTDLVEKANRVFCQGGFASHFATLVCGRFNAEGDVEICNAGHCLPLHVRRTTVSAIPSAGLPVGILGDGEYPSQHVKLERGDQLVLYTDGLSEAFNRQGQPYGSERLKTLLECQAASTAKGVLETVLSDVKEFRAQITDDLTVMVLSRR
jgi:sigma-B regulation protein RsbU (phosphoserine phosphatase)